MGQKKYDWILDKLNKGMTVYISTYLTTTEITKKTFDNFLKAGIPLLKVIKESLYIYEKKKYVSADYCKISAV